MEENFFDKRVKNNIRTYENIQKFARSQEDDYITYNTSYNTSWRSKSTYFGLFKKKRAGIVNLLYFKIKLI